VAGIDLDVAEGAVHSLLGPNGAGKTTTVEILEGHRRRDGGEVSVLGADPATAGRAWRARIGIVLQDASDAAELTVAESVWHFAGYYARPRDPEARRQFWTLVRSLADGGTTVLLTTHYLDEAEALADRVSVIVGGRIVAEDTPAGLGGRASAAATVHWVDDTGRHDVRTDTPTALVRQPSGHGELAELTVRRPSLEDVYLDLIGAQR
jgi:ABC-2 type transport system ATP-binding protein